MFLGEKFKYTSEFSIGTCKDYLSDQNLYAKVKLDYLRLGWVSLKKFCNNVKKTQSTLTL